MYFEILPNISHTFSDWELKLTRKERTPQYTKRETYWEVNTPREIPVQSNGAIVAELPAMGGEIVKYSSDFLRCFIWYTHVHTCRLTFFLPQFDHSSRICLCFCGQKSTKASETCSSSRWGGSSPHQHSRDCKCKRILLSFSSYIHFFLLNFRPNL